MSSWDDYLNDLDQIASERGNADGVVWHELDDGGHLTADAALDNIRTGLPRGLRAVAVLGVLIRFGDHRRRLPQLSWIGLRGNVAWMVTY